MASSCVMRAGRKRALLTRNIPNRIDEAHIRFVEKAMAHSLLIAHVVIKVFQSSQCMFACCAVAAIGGSFWQCVASSVVNAQFCQSVTVSSTVTRNGHQLSGSSFETERETVKFPDATLIL